MEHISNESREGATPSMTVKQSAILVQVNTQCSYGREQVGIYVERTQGELSVLMMRSPNDGKYQLSPTSSRRTRHNLVVLGDSRGECIQSSEPSIRNTIVSTVEIGDNMKVTTNLKNLRWGKIPNGVIVKERRTYE